ncbi:DNA-binding transcriptional MocR family regulator [Haloactinospora alba]|uniref:DNA-binding transcriptional MocR family regulator n=1 Tax=Haloactinospora alba TaxID=405555 RepID=A0A543N916_9ACTN|nr:PLP-dependent aminotransferase family protein [Haloactinospora alba]TQN28324.1 DNA-binding transcriptional MocR family regulator [Haloactinospora alba]
MSKPIPAAEIVTLLGRWAAGRGALYRLLAARLRALVDEGAIAPDSTLPPDRTLAGHLAVGRGTVVAAYDLLRDEGVVVRHRGSGTRVASRGLPVAPSDPTQHTGGAYFLSMLDDVPGSLVLTCAAPDTPPPELRPAFHRAADGLGELTNDIGYHPTGHPELRRAVADRFTARGLATAPEQVLVTTGAQQALALLVRHYVSPGDTVLTERPTYPGILPLLADAAADTRTVPVTAQGRDVDTYAHGMGRSRPALTYVVPSFHNPTGALMPPLQRRRLVRITAEHEVPLVEDETVCELGFDGPPPPPLAAYPGGERVVTVGSLSKVAWGGLRVGWIRSDAATVTRLARLKAITDLGTNVVGQVAACHLLGTLDGLAQRRREELARRHDHLCALLDRWLPDWEYGRASGGQTLWVRLPGTTGASFAQVALRHGVALLSGDVLAPGAEGADHLRLPFLPDEETLDTAVHRLSRAWEEHTSATGRTATLNAMVV